MRPNFRRATVFLVLALAAVGAFALELSVGAARIPLRDVVSSLAGDGSDAPAMARQIVREVRFPRAVMASCVGALLAVAGALLQGLLRNPLAEPYLLGISSGAGLAVTVAMVLGLPMVIGGVYAIPFVAFAGALLALVAVYYLAQFRGRLMVTTLILAGVVVSAFLSSVITLLASFSSSRFLEVFSWLLGHLQPAVGGVEWWILGYTVAGLAVALAQARDLNALMLGEEEAESLGVNVERLKRVLFLLSSLLTGVAVSVSGLIGFVGLVAPHIARLLAGADHRALVPASALAGAALLLLADTVSRVAIAPAELPAGVVTALVGGPFFLVLLLRHAREVSRRPR